LNGNVLHHTNDPDSGVPDLNKLADCVFRSEIFYSRVSRNNDIPGLIQRCFAGDQWKRKDFEKIAIGEEYFFFKLVSIDFYVSIGCVKSYGLFDLGELALKGMGGRKLRSREIEIHITDLNVSCYPEHTITIFMDAVVRKFIDNKHGDQ